MAYYLLGSMRTTFFLVALVLLAGCQMRPHNPLLGKWDAGPPGTKRLLIFNNDGTFVLETDLGGRKAIEEGSYTREGDVVEMQFWAGDAAAPERPEAKALGRRVMATLDRAAGTLVIADEGAELRFSKR